MRQYVLRWLTQTGMSSYELSYPVVVSPRTYITVTVLKSAVME